MIMNKTNLIQPQQINIPEAVNALILFMNGQMQFNMNVKYDLRLINKELYQPAMRRKDNLVCMSAIL